MRVFSRSLISIMPGHQRIPPSTVSALRERITVIYMFVLMNHTSIPFILTLANQQGPNVIMSKFFGINDNSIILRVTVHDASI